MDNKAGLRGDKRGVMELPLKMIIMIILISASVSIGMVSYGKIQQRAFEQHVMDELNGLTLLSLMISREGNLSSHVMELDLSSNIFAGIDRIRFGDTVGGRTEVITYSMNWREQREVMYLGDELHLTSAVNSSFMLRSGIHDIRLTCMHINDDTTVVIVSYAGQRIDYPSFYS